MMKRRKLSKRVGRKHFSRSARKVHKKNLRRGGFLGGYRL